MVEIDQGPHIQLPIRRGTVAHIRRETVAHIYERYKSCDYTSCIDPGPVTPQVSSKTHLGPWTIAYAR